VGVMTEIVLFHHIQGLTQGVVAFADTLREAGHTVHTPDVFEGRTFESIEAGEVYCREVGFDEMRRRGVRLAEDLPDRVVYGGFSLGVMAAQYLVQNRPGALGALFYHGVIDPAEFGAWPSGVPAQVHAMDADPEFIDSGDLEAATPFLAGHDEVQLYLYPGDGHLFSDSSLPGYDAEATETVIARVTAFLERVGA
jgi:dienelactone hydrolase